jgi:hypothetical protein
LRQIASEKAAAVGSSDEDYANLLLGCECVARSLFAELQMWLLLKQEDPDAAWDQLIEAQGQALWAVRAHEGFKHLEHHHEKLQVIERVVFPPQVFLSAGLIVERQECSICQADYEDCEHIVGRPYMGEFCWRIARNVQADHVSFVEQPADKRCRVLAFEDEGGRRNRMTWRAESTEGNADAHVRIG